MTERKKPLPPERGALLPYVEGAEKAFLAGRRSREADLESGLRIFLEFLRAFDSFEFDQPCVTVFGSARFAEGHRYYKLAREVGFELARAGYAVMTGGGSGVMEAANRGAHEAGGLSIGCNSTLPREQKPNKYLEPFITARPLLRTQGDAGEVLECVRGHAGRLRHARRDVRDRHAHADGQAGTLSADRRRPTVLGPADLLRARHDDRRRNAQRGGRAIHPPRRHARGGRAVDPSAVSVFYVDSYIPSYFEMLATINAVKPPGGAVRSRA